MLLVLVEGERLGQLVHLAVDAHPNEAVRQQLFQFLAVLPLAPADDGGEQEQAGFFRVGLDPADHLLHGLRGDLPAAGGAVHPADAGEEQAQIIVYLGDRADGGAGVSGGGLLLDGNGRREPLDALHVRLLHLLEELPGIGGEALHIAALPFGVDGVEGKGRFSRTGDAGDDHQPVAGDLHVEALQVMFPGAPDDDFIWHKCSG